MLFSKYKKQFFDAEAPNSIPTGNFQVVWLGPTWFQFLARSSLSYLSFRNWWGKAFDGSNNAYNLFSIPNSQDFLKKYPMRVSIKNSLLDGQPALFLEYEKDAPFPWPYFIDEFRIINQTDLLGMSYSRISPKLAMPFLIRKM
jgi:hypothetical protein